MAIISKLVAVAALALSTAAFADAAADLTDFSTRIASAAGRFTQTVIASDGKAEPEQSGTFSFQKPGRFHWYYRKPYEQQLVSDGRRLWVYDMDIDQVTVTPIPETANNPAAILAGGDVSHAFALRNAGTSNGLEWVKATPKAKSSQFSEVLVGMSGGLPHELRLKDTFGVTTVVVFNELKANAPVNGSEFTFVPPKGVDVIEQTGARR